MSGLRQMHPELDVNDISFRFSLFVWGKDKDCLRHWLMIGMRI